MRWDLGEYDEFETRVNKFKTYERTSSFLINYWVFVFLGINALIIYILGTFFGIGFVERQMWGVFIIFAVVIVSLVIVTTKKKKKYELRDDEWTKFYTYSILYNLEKYSRASPIGMKEDYRKKAVKKAKEFLSCINKRWKIGSFMMAKDYFGNSISELKNNIRYRLIPNLKDGDDELLGKIKQHMGNFLMYSNFDLESINI